jgi:hypothetical protein
MIAAAAPAPSAVHAVATELAESTAIARGPAAWGATRAEAQRLGLWPAAEAGGPAPLVAAG